MSKQVWARIGVSVPMTDEEYEKFAELTNAPEEDWDAKEVAMDMFWNAFHKAHTFTGDSYLPAHDDYECNPNEEWFTV